MYEMAALYAAIRNIISADLLQCCQMSAYIVSQITGNWGILLTAWSGH